MAEPALGATLPDRLPGCVVCEDAARRTGGKPSRLPRDRGSDGRGQRCSGTVDGGNGRAEVLVDGSDGTAQSRSAGCFHCLCGWTERVSGSDRSGFSEDADSALHRASDPEQLEIRFPQGAQAGGSRPEGDLQCPDGGSRRIRAQAIRRKMGWPLSSHSRVVGTPLGANHSIFCVSSTGTEGHLHHQRDRIAEYVTPQDHQNARCFSERASGGETSLSCIEKRGARLATKRHQTLDRGLEPVRRPLGGSHSGSDKKLRRRARGDAIHRPRMRTKPINESDATFFSQSWIRDRKKGEGLVETAAAVEIESGGLRHLLLVISTAAWKSLRKERSGFPTVTTGPAAGSHPHFGMLLRNLTPATVYSAER